MSRADYEYRIKRADNLLYIIDLNRGNTSLTNDIQNVVEEISIKENVDPRKLTITYRDSTGRWDGYDYETDLFVFRAQNYDELF